MTKSPVAIAIPKSWTLGLLSAGALLGIGAAFLIAPVVNLLLRLAGDAPGPLRLAAGLPLTWSIPILAIAGLGLGFWVAREWQKENGTIAISSDGVTVQRGGTGSHVSRDQISQVFSDGRDLVLVDGQTNELLRTKTDKALVTRLREAFEGLGYAWYGSTDPHEHAFVTWIEGKGTLDRSAQNLLRARQRAIADKRSGAAEEARDDLRDLGIAVRDRNDTQQYRVVPQHH